MMAPITPTACKLIYHYIQSSGQQSLHLKQLRPATVRAAGDHEALDDLPRVWARHRVLVAKAAHHDGDQEAEEGLQLPQFFFGIFDKKRQK